MNNAQDTIYITYIKATLAQVWAALTDGALTQKYFFGRRVESSWTPRAPWTLYTAEGAKDVWGEVLETDRPRRLVVTWEVNMPPGTPPLPQTIVSYDLEQIGEVVKLTMTEHHAGPIEERFLEGGRQGWPRILSGLKSLLETGAALPLPIPPPPAGANIMTSFVYVTYIRATPEKLWQALTEPEFTKQFWFGGWQDSEWKPGSSWTLRMPDKVTDAGEVLEIEKPKRIVLKWRNEFKPELTAEGYSRCEFDIVPMGDTVQLTITHSIDVEGAKLIDAVSGGWPKILSSLKSLLETGTALERTSN